MNQLCCGYVLTSEFLEPLKLRSLKTPVATFKSGQAETEMFGNDNVDTPSRLLIGSFGHIIAFADSSGSYHMIPFQKKTTGNISSTTPQHGSSFTSVADRHGFLLLVCSLALSATNNQMLPVHTNRYMPRVQQWSCNMCFQVCVGQG